MTDDIEDRITRIQKHRGVKGLLICTFKSSEGKDELGSGAVQVVKSTMAAGEMTNKYAKNLAELAQ